MADIEWAEPPPPKAGPHSSVFTEQVLAALRANPGKWALIKRDHPNAQSAADYPKRHPEFETTARGSNKHFDIYARYIGDGEKP